MSNDITDMKSLSDRIMKEIIKHVKSDSKLIILIEPDLSDDELNIRFISGKVCNVLASNFKTLRKEIGYGESTTERADVSIRI
jgi:hypothetical protein